MSRAAAVIRAVVLQYPGYSHAAQYASVLGSASAPYPAVFLRPLPGYC